MPFYFSDYKIRLNDVCGIYEFDSHHIHCSEDNGVINVSVMTIKVEALRK